MSGVSWDAIISAVAATATLVIALIGLLFFYDRRRAARYDHDRNRAELEAMRDSMERRIYELTKRQLATESRWRDANHLLLDSQSYQASGTTSTSVQLTPFLKNAGLTAEDLKPDPRLVFVLTSFHSEFRDTYEIISDVCRDLGLRALRGDEDYVAGDILSHILRLMVRARLVITNVDGRNPNVFYELGIAHAINKTTILVGTPSAELPFDVRAERSSSRISRNSCGPH